MPCEESDGPIVAMKNGPMKHRTRVHPKCARPVVPRGATVRGENPVQRRGPGLEWWKRMNGITQARGGSQKVVAEEANTLLETRDGGCEIPFRSPHRQDKVRAHGKVE